MRWVRRFLSVAASVALVLTFVASVPAKATDAAQYPTTVAGLPVMFVQTSENTRGMSAGDVVLVLSSPELQVKPATSAAIAAYLTNNPLPKGWSVGVYGGPNATLQELRKAIDWYNNLYDKYGSLLSQSQLLALQPEGAQSRPELLGSGPRTFAADLNVDPIYGGNTVTWQSAWWVAPQKYQGAGNAYAYLGNNAWTNAGFFLQAGQIFYSGLDTGINVWTDSNIVYPRPLAPQAFTTVPYVVGHVFQFSIGYGGPNTWFMAATDQSAGASFAQYDYNAAGTKLQYTENTSVFFENTNTDPAWYQLFNTGS